MAPLTAPDCIVAERVATNRESCRPAARRLLAVLALAVTLAAGWAVLLGCTVVGFDTPYNKGIEAYRAGHLAEAIEQFQVAVAEAPEFHEAWYNLARAYDERAEAYRVRADEAEQAGRDEEAEQLRTLGTDSLDKADNAYREAIRHNPKSARARVSYAMFRYDQGDTATAREQLQQAVAAESDRAYPRTALGYFYQREGAWPQAREQYRRALEREPQHPLTLYRLATWYDEQGRHAEARDAYHEVLKVARDDELTWLRLGYVYAALNDPVRAAGALDRYLMLTRPSPETNRRRATILLDIADLYLSAGRYEPAVEALWSARLYAPAEVDVSEKLQLAYTRLLAEEQVRGNEYREGTQPRND